MRRWILLAPLALAAAAVPAGAEAANSVGLGVGAGVAIPHGKILDTKAELNWGFHVDIPILQTFAITPSTYLYRYGDTHATDVSINFKFVIPLGLLDIFGGVTAGLTSTNRLDPHVGALAGAEISIVSNLHAFVQVNYRLVILENEDVRDLMVFAGPVFRF